MFRNMQSIYLRALLVILMIGLVLYFVTTILKIESFNAKLEKLTSKVKLEIGGSKAKDDTYPQRKCYEYETKREFNITDWFLEDILEATRQPQRGRTIFFHITNCLDLYMEMDNRQACAIESAAKLNPESDIFVLFVSPVAFSLDMSLVTRSLLQYPNIYFRNVDIWKYSKNTPGQEWIHDRNQLLKSKYLAVHLSDYIRLVRYGGTHMDHDFILIKSISNIEPNYACSPSNISVNNAILNFDHVGFGHEFVERILRDFVHYFDGTGFANNGPMLITSLLGDVCKTNIISEMKRKKCNFEVMDQEAFYPLEWPDWKLFFDPERTAEVEAKTKNSMGVHFWNAASHNYTLHIGSEKKSLYEKLAIEFCPRIYESLDKTF